jgi:hypothetical protein
MENRRSKIGNRTFAGLLSLLIGLLVVGGFYLPAPGSWLLAPPVVNAQSATSHRFPAFGFILDSPSIAIAGATVDTSATSTEGVSSAQISWVFGTVVGSYTACTVQAKTSIDGSGWLTLGTAASVTATSNTVNVWTIMGQAPTTSVTTSAVSSSVALNFGQMTKYTFACSGSYGTTTPVTVTAIYK